MLARKTLDDELALLTSSLMSGAPINFDYAAALSGIGNGWYGGSTGTNEMGIGSAYEHCCGIRHVVCHGLRDGIEHAYG